MKLVTRSICLLVVVREATALPAFLTCSKTPRPDCTVDKDITDILSVVEELNRSCDIGCTLTVEEGTLQVDQKCRDENSVTFGVPFKIPEGLVADKSATLNEGMDPSCISTTKDAITSNDPDAACPLTKGTLMKLKPLTKNDTYSVEYPKFLGQVKIPMTDPEKCGAANSSLHIRTKKMTFDVGTETPLPPLTDEGHQYLPAPEDADSAATIGTGIYTTPSVCPSGSYINGVAQAVNRADDRTSVLRYLRFHCSDFATGHLPNNEVLSSHPYKYTDVLPLEMCDGDGIYGGDHVTAFQLVRDASTGLLKGVRFYCESGKVIGDRRDLGEDKGAMNLRPWKISEDRIIGFATSVDGYGLGGFVAVVGELGERCCKGKQAI